MDDLIVVRVFEWVTNLDGDVDDARDFSRTRLGESRSSDELHHEERKSIRFADVVNGNDVWMIECSGSACFAHETFTRIGILRSGGENFDGDFSLQFQIGGAIDSSHATASELTIESVAVTQNCAQEGDSRAQLIRKDARLL